MATGTVTLGNGTFRATVAPILTSAGFERVAEGLATTNAAPHPSAHITFRNSSTENFQTAVYYESNVAPRRYDVWRSPAAANNDGADWFLVVMETADANGVRTSDSTGLPEVGFAVAEGFDVATGKFSKAPPSGPLATATAPASDFSFPTALSPNQMTYSALATPRSDFLLDATARRVFLYTGATLPAAQSVVFAGLAERLLPITKEPRTPLATFMVTASSATSNHGSCTREPSTTTANNANFRVVGNGSAWALTGAADPHLGSNWSYPPVTRSFRNANISSARFLIPEIRAFATGNVLGDTLAETQYDGTVVNYTAVGFTNHFVRVP